MLRPTIAVLLIGATLALSSGAFAQDLPAAEVEQAVAPSSSTPAGSLLNYAYLALAGLAAFGLSRINEILGEKAKQGAFWALFNKMWLKAQSTVSYVEGQVRPEFQKAMADGKLDDAEKKFIADKAWAIFREKAHEELQALPKVMQIAGDAAIEQFGRGLLERALAASKGGAPIAAMPTLPPIPKPSPIPPPAPTV